MGRYNEELYQEYREWLPYITDVFLPIINTETGDFNSFPNEGGILQQGAITMNILKIIQSTYKKVLIEKQKEMIKKNRPRK